MKNAEIPDDFFTHKNSWLAALDRLVALETNDDDKSYWEHERNAMVRAYAELECTDA